MDGPHHFATFYHDANCNVTNSQYHFSTFYHYSSCNVTNSQHHFAVCNALCTTRPTAILPRADATLQRSTTRTTAVTKSQCHFATLYHEASYNATNSQCHFVTSDHNASFYTSCEPKKETPRSFLIGISSETSKNSLRRRLTESYRAKAPGFEKLSSA